MLNTKKEKYKKVAIVVAGVGLLLFLMALPYMNGEIHEAVGEWKDAGIECLSAGHERLVLHIHPQLSISVDGEPETIPANLGIVTDCMSEVHTHDETGVLHIESTTSGKEFTLGQFFAVWEDRDLEREGYSLLAYVDGEPIDDPADLVLEDRQQILLEYALEEEE